MIETSSVSRSPVSTTTTTTTPVRCTSCEFPFAVPSTWTRYACPRCSLAYGLTEGTPELPRPRPPQAAAAPTTSHPEGKDADETVLPAQIISIHPAVYQPPPGALFRVSIPPSKLDDNPNASCMEPNPSSCSKQ